jgi:protein-tyrosine phosphatase
LCYPGGYPASNLKISDFVFARSQGRSAGKGLFPELPPQPATRFFRELRVMIDIHCHILPGIDDGPETMAETISMFRIAGADGITKIVATPHYRHGEAPDISRIQEKIAGVKEQLLKNRISVELLCGADIRLTYELMKGIEKKEIPTINGSRYFLLELPDLIPPRISECLYEARLRGYLPVITHPERNYSLIAAPEKIRELRAAGGYFQVTAMSLTGKFGSRVKKLTEELLKKGYADFVATDAHSTKGRPPLLSSAYQCAVRLLNKAEADRIFLENPEKLMENKEIKLRKTI